MEGSLARVDELDEQMAWNLSSRDVRVSNSTLDDVYAVPDVIRCSSEGVRELSVGEKDFRVHLERILGSVGRDLNYTVGVRPVGKCNFPGAGRKRAYSLLAHNDLRSHPHFLVWFPGFGHQLVSRTVKWEMALQAQIARALGVNILCVNPGGRGVPGSAAARGVSSITTEKLTADTVHATRQLIATVLSEAGVTADAEIDMIVTGHSLGAYLARAMAHDIATIEDRFVLRGLIQEAPIAAGTGEDLLYTNHWKAILPHLAEAVGRALVPMRGMEFKLGGLQRLFYGESCSVEDVAANAWALVPAEAANFLGLSLLPGDLKKFIQTVTLAHKSMQSSVRGIGSTIIFPTHDAVFSRVVGGVVQDQMYRATQHLGTRAVPLSGTHCYVKAGATRDEKLATRDAYRLAYGLPELELDRF